MTTLTQKFNTAYNSAQFKAIKTEDFKPAIVTLLEEARREIDAITNNTETARTVLSTFIAGLISIMVFSFSMVMILLNSKF